jgi:Ran GTPase-activating protein (RanGAP) involved in mRNA processing and transport
MSRLCRASETLFEQLERNEPNFTQLHLEGWAMITFPRDRLAASLQHNEYLVHLSLAACRLGDEGVKLVLCPSLGKGRPPALEHLNLSANGITDTGAQALAQALQHHKNIKELILSWNGISDAGAIALAETIRVNPSLRRLELDGIFEGRGGGCRDCVLGTDQLEEGSQCNIGDAGCIALAQVLPGSNLECLKLSRQACITANGVAALAFAITAGSKLKHLELHRVPVDDEGAIALSKCLMQLETLGLMISKITDRGAVALAKAIAASNNLVSVGLTQNEIGAEGLAALVAAVAANTTLQCLDLYGHAGDKQGKMYVRQVKPWLRVNKYIRILLREERKELYAHILAKAARLKDGTRLYRLLREMPP